MMTDSIADMLTRIRNANRIESPAVDMPSTKVKVTIAQVLKDEGFIRDFAIEPDGARSMLKIELSYTGRKEPVLSGIKRVSKPGLRVYVQKREIPRVLGGLGVAILSTPEGVMTGQNARQKSIGGEILCYVW